MHPRRQRPAKTSASSLSRRTFLRGVGTVLALPCLDAMLPKVARAAGVAGKPPVRMAFLFSPNGVIPDSWTPKDFGAHYTLSPSLEPLAGVREEILVLSGFSQKKGFDLGDGAGDQPQDGPQLPRLGPWRQAGENLTREQDDSGGVILPKRQMRERSRQRRRAWRR